MRARNKKALAAAVAMAIGGITVASHQAFGATGTDTWVGNTSGNWADANWSGANNPPASGDSLFFDLAGTAGATLVDNLMTPATYTLSGLTFGAGAAAFSISAFNSNNGFTLNGGITDSAANNQSITDPITFTGGTQTLTNTGAGTLTLGALSNASGGVTLSGTGPVRVNGTTGTLGGVLTLNAGTTLETSADFHAGGLTGSGNVFDPTTADKWFFVTNAVSGNTETYSGAITGGSSKLGLNYTGPGALILTGTNEIDDAINVNSGTVVYSGGHNNTTQVDQVGVVAGANAVLILPSTGTFSSNDNTGQPYSSSMNVSSSSTANTAGDLQNPGATFIVNRQLAVGGNGYGAYTQTAGATTIGGFLAVGGTTSGGLVNLSGGTVTLTTGDTGAVTIGYNGSNAATVGNLNISGNASFTDNANTNGGVWIGEVNMGVLNMSGSSTLTINSGGTVGGGGGLNLGKNNASNANGTVDLDGGTLTTPYVVRGSGTTTGTLSASSAVFNFNGGTLKANAPNTTFMTGLNAAYVYGGGATIDDGGNAITIGQALQAPTGNGISATGMTFSGGGYIDTPIVTVSGGGGVGAEAVANIDANGNLTGVTITNPGTGYTSAPTFTLVGGGIGNTGSIGGSASLVANVSGGLTKQGAGSLTLTGANTYGGGTTITAGALVLGGAGSINGSSGITVNGTGAKFVQTSSVAVTPSITITNGTLDGAGSITAATIADSASNVLADGNGAAAQLSIASLTFSGAATFNAVTDAAAQTTPGVLVTTFSDSSNAAKKITVNASTTDASWAIGTYDLLSFTTLGSGNGLSDFTLGAVAGLTARQTPSLSLSGNEVALTISGISGSDVWTGLNNGNWTTAVQTPNKNWTLNSSPTDYLNADQVTFDNTATGTTNVSITDATVTPTSVTFNNTSKNYAIGGAGSIAGSTSVVLNGTATVSIGNSNSYSGGTVLNAGTLNINNAHALGSGTLTIAGGAIDATTGAISVSTANAQVWNNSFTFNGTNPLNLGTGAVAMSTNVTVTANASTLTVGGTITAASGMALSTAGPGTVVLSGSGSNISGGVSVGAGTLSVPAGSISSAGGLINVGTVASVNTIMSVSGTGSVNATDTAPGQFANSMGVGSATNSVGDLQVSGSGAVTTAEQLSMGTNTGAYGALTNNGGNVTSGSFLIAGFATNAVGVINQNSGTISLSSNFITIGAGGTTTSTGELNVYGGTLNSTATVGSPYGTIGGMQVGEFGTGIFNMQNGAANFSGHGMDLGVNAGATGIVNLNGGTLTTNVVTSGVNGTWNFNGGVLAANASTVGFFSPTTAYVYAGGAIINDGGNNVTVSTGLSAPTGNGVTATGLAVSGSGFIDTPVVQISGGGGVGATAVANINSSGQLTSVTMTNPGVGYTSAPTFTLLGGGGTGLITGSASLAANVGGGFTKMGAGTLTLAGTSTYTGPTTISAGTLSLPAQIAPLPVANYTFNNVTDSGGNPVSAGNALNAGDIVPNTGTGGSALNGAVNINDSITGFSGVTLENSGGNKFGGNFVNFDGTGTSIDVPSQIVDQSGGGTWSMSIWLQTTTPGSAFVSKNTGGAATSWAVGNSVFYLGSNPPSATPGSLPTGVQNSGGFLQGNTSVTDGSWHMVTFVDNAGSKAVYVDGVATSLSDTAFTGTDISNFVRIGFNVDTLSNLDGNINYTGNLTDLSFYGAALNAAQVLQLFNTNTVGTVNQNYLPTTTPVNITASGAALAINGQQATIGSLAGVAGSSVTLGGGELSIGGVTGSTNFAGVISGAGVVQFNGPGTLALSGANTYTGGTNVTGGLVQIQSTGTPGASALADGPVSVSGGKLQLAASTGLATITGLSISGGGTFDVNNNHLIVNYGASADPIASIAALLKAGYNGGAWNGAGGIVSTAAAANHLSYGLGYADSADTGNPANLSAGTIEVKYTLLGDANLDGVVNGIDFGILAANFNHGVTGWDKGDFNYDNVVNGIDFGELAANFNKGATGASIGLPAYEDPAILAFAAQNGLLADVPEPASIGLLAAGAVGLLARRRRK